MSSIKEVICICCPCGCHLQVDPENDYNVTENACPNGAAYGREEKIRGKTKYFFF